MIHIGFTSIQETTNARYECQICHHTFDAREPRRHETNQDVACPKCHVVDTTMIGPPLNWRPLPD